MSSRFLRVAAQHPAGALSANVDVGKWAGRSARGIQPDTADKIGIRTLDSLDSRQHDPSVGEVHAAVVIDVVHTAVLVGVDDDIRSVTKLMTAVQRPPALGAEPKVVVGCAKSGEHVHSGGANSVSLEVLDDELQLVEKRLAQNDVLGPHICLVVREEVVKLKMLRDAHVFIVARHLDESRRILVGLGPKAAFLLRPVTHPVCAYRAGDFIAERLHRDHREATDLAGAGDFLNCRDELGRIAEIICEGGNPDIARREDEHRQKLPALARQMADHCPEARAVDDRQLGNCRDFGMDVEPCSRLRDRDARDERQQYKSGCQAGVQVRAQKIGTPAGLC